MILSGNTIVIIGLLAAASSLSLYVTAEIQNWRGSLAYVLPVVLSLGIAMTGERLKSLELQQTALATLAQCSTELRGEPLEQWVTCVSSLTPSHRRAVLLCAARDSDCWARLVAASGLAVAARE